MMALNERINITAIAISTILFAGLAQMLKVIRCYYQAKEILICLLKSFAPKLAAKIEPPKCTEITPKHTASALHAGLEHFCSHEPRKCVQCLADRYNAINVGRKSKSHIQALFRILLLLYSPIHCPAHCPNLPRPARPGALSSIKRSQAAYTDAASSDALELKIIKLFARNLAVLGKHHGDTRMSDLLAHDSLRSSSELVARVAATVDGWIRRFSTRLKAFRLAGGDARELVLLEPDKGGFSDFEKSASALLGCSPGGAEGGSSERKKALVTLSRISLTQKVHDLVLSEISSKRPMRSLRPKTPNLAPTSKPILQRRVSLDDRLSALVAKRKQFDFAQFQKPLTAERADIISDPKKQHAGRFHWGKISVKGERKSMEDEMTIFEDFNLMLPQSLQNFSTFFGVYDGHRGRAAPNFCKRYLHLHTALCAAEGARLGRGLGESLRLGYERTEASFVTAASRAGDLSGSTSLTVVLNPAEQRCVVANLGDSRAIICRDGCIEELTRDHTPADADERSRVLAEGGVVRQMRVGGSLSVSRTFGDLDERTGAKLTGLSAAPELCEVELGADFEFLLAACDGAWEQNSSEQLGRMARRLLRARSSPQAVVEELAEHLISQRHATDNVTIILISSMKNDPQTGQQFFVPPARSRAKFSRKAPSFFGSKTMPSVRSSPISLCRSARQM